MKKQTKISKSLYAPVVLQKPEATPSMALIPAGQNLPARVTEAISFLKEIDGAPMRDRILVARADPKKAIHGTKEDGSEYEIIIPDIAQETQGVGMVVAVGSGHYLDGANVPLDLKPGDVVFFNKYAGTETQVGPFKLLRLREEEIEFKADPNKCMALAASVKKESQSA